MKELPKDHWILYNIQIITFGRKYLYSKEILKCGGMLLKRNIAQGENDMRSLFIYLKNYKKETILAPLFKNAGGIF